MRACWLVALLILPFAAANAADPLLSSQRADGSWADEDRDGVTTLACLAVHLDPSQDSSSAADRCTAWLIEHADGAGAWHVVGGRAAGNPALTGVGALALHIAGEPAARDSALSFLVAAQREDGTWAVEPGGSADLSVTNWACTALAIVSPDGAGSALDAIVLYVENVTRTLEESATPSVDSLALLPCAATLRAAGRDSADLTRRLVGVAEDIQATDGSFGPWVQTNAVVMLGLRLATGVAEERLDALAAWITASANEDGSWGAEGDTIVETSLALLALRTSDLGAFNAGVQAAPPPSRAPASPSPSVSIATPPVATPPGVSESPPPHQDVPWLTPLELLAMGALSAAVAPRGRWRA